MKTLKTIALIASIISLLFGCAGASSHLKSAETNKTVAAVDACNTTPKREINLIGFSIGMNYCEVPGFTKFGEFDEPSNKPVMLMNLHVKPSFIFTDNKLSSVSIEISPLRFDTLKAAYMKKYPALKCSQNAVQNGFGAKFDNETCMVESDKEILIIEKYAGNIKEGIILLSDKKLLERKKFESKELEKNI